MNARPKKVIGIPAMVLVALGAFGFSFALVPLYRIACEKVFGIRLEQGAADIGDVQAATRKDRLVTVTFDSSVNSKLPWEFRPDTLTMQVHPGKVYETTYSARNIGARDIVGSATPSVTPARASQYFNKTECFCFTAQTLVAGEARELPVRFVIDPDLPEDIDSVVLSYTFFRNDELTSRLDTRGGTSGGAKASP